VTQSAGGGGIGVSARAAPVASRMTSAIARTEACLALARTIRPQNWTCGAVAAPACALKYAFSGNLLRNRLAVMSVGKLFRAVL